MQTSSASYPAAPKDHPHIVLVGGGISGLSAAFYLQQAAGEHIRYTLIEREERWGGKLLTDTLGDFVVEGGPDSLLTQKPWGVQLARELGLEDQLVPTNDMPHKVYFLVDGQPRPMPDGMSLIVPTRFGPFVRSPLLSFAGKLRMALDLVLPARRNHDDETLADFIRRRFGQEALLKLAEPLLAGIHNSESERQSLLATFPRLRELEQQYGSLIRGMRASAKKAQAIGRTVAPFLTPRGGVGALADALVGALHGRLIAGHAVAAITHNLHAEQPYQVRLDDGELLNADAVILTAPAFAAADLVASFQPQLAEALRRIRYVTTGTVSLAYRKQAVDMAFDGYGLVIPRTERRRINAVTIASRKFNHRAPEDAVLIRVFVGGTRNPDVIQLSDAELLQLVRAELGDIVGVRAEPEWSRIYRWPRANPQYDVGHLERIAALEALCPAGLVLCGSAYRGVGIPDCVRQGKAAAEQVWALVQSRAVVTV